MSNFVLELSVSIKELLREKINILIMLVIILIACNLISILYINNKIDRICKKIDHRYFNLNTSIEEIHKVKINTANGEIKTKF